MDCNEEACKPEPYVYCKSKLDVVLMLDGSGSVREKGFAHIKHAAERIIDNLEMGGDSVMLSVMLFSGPRTWSKMYQCYYGEIDDLSKCGIKWVTGEWTSDKWDTIKRVEALTWPQGGTLTGMALGEAKNELGKSRVDAVSTVVVITDGKPSYPWKTMEAAMSLRDTARLMWVPVGAFVKYSDFKNYASYPPEENVIPNPERAPIRNLDELELPSFPNMVVENLCPDLAFDIGGPELNPA